MKKRIFCAIAMLAALAACTKPSENYASGEGSLTLRIGGMTKAAMSSDELLNTSLVKIYKADFSGLVRSYVYSEMPSTLYLPADSYRIDVTAGELSKETPAAASWEQKSYKGSKETTVVAGQNSSVSIEAKICNIVSNVSFDASIDGFFSEGYSCTVGLSADDASQQLVYSASDSGKDGYFLSDGFEPSLYWSFSGTLSKSGETFTKSGEIPAVESGKRYKFTLKYNEKDGLLVFDLVVDDSTNDVYDNIIFVPVSTGISASSKFEIWAGHFTAHADVDEGEYDSASVAFEYKPAEGGDWTRVAATRESEGTYSALISGLAAQTEYAYRLVVTPLGAGAEEYMDAPSTITTDAAPQAPNSGFEVTSNDESRNYPSFYDPASSDPELQSKWWCSGNAGSTMVSSSYRICYPDTGDYREGSQSACLSSRYVVVKFAAGNLFSGHFGETIGTSGGTVFFGRPFTARPTAMRLWVKYSSGPINRVDGTPDGVQKGDYDKASLKIALGNWDYKKYGGDPDSPILVNTTDTNTFVDFNTDASTIAYGEKIITSDAENSTNVWGQVTIPLNYTNTTKYPSHIVISFAASMYGDYFTGCDSSLLWVDGLELLYE